MIFILDIVSLNAQDKSTVLKFFQVCKEQTKKSDLRIFLLQDDKTKVDVEILEAIGPEVKVIADIEDITKNTKLTSHKVKLLVSPGLEKHFTSKFDCELLNELPINFAAYQQDLHPLQTVGLDLFELSNRYHRNNGFFSASNNEEKNLKKTIPEARIEIDPYAIVTERSPLLTTRVFSHEEKMAAFRYFGNFLPEEMRLRLLALSFFAFGLSVMSVVQTVFFGLGFVGNFANEIAKKLNVKLTADDIETIRVSFASCSALVNIGINKGTIEDSSIKLKNKIDEFADTEETKAKARVALTLLRDLLTTGIGAAPTFFTALLSGREQNLPDIINFTLAAGQWGVGTTMLWVGLGTLENNITRWTNPVHVEVTRIIRGSITKRLNLGLNHPVSDAGLKLLADGRQYWDKYPKVREVTTKYIAPTAPVPYVIITTGLAVLFGFMAYAAKASIPEIAVTLIILGAVLAILATLLKYGFLAGNLEAAIHTFNDIPGTPILGDKNDTLLKRIGNALGLVFFFVIAEASLGGADGTTKEVAFPKQNSLIFYVLSIIISQGAYGPNFNAFRNAALKAWESNKRLMARFWYRDKEPQKNVQNLYQASREDLIKYLITVFTTAKAIPLVEKYSRVIPNDLEKGIDPKLIIKADKSKTYIFNGYFESLRHHSEVLQTTTEDDYRTFIEEEARFVNMWGLITDTVMKQASQLHTNNSDIPTIDAKDMPRPTGSSISQKVREVMDTFEEGGKKFKDFFDSCRSPATLENNDRSPLLGPN